jgi:localization factor PodJL
MTKIAADFELGQSHKQSGGRAPEFACAGEDLKEILQALTEQVAHADQRNSHALEYMRERLELLGRDAGQARQHVSPEQGVAFSRIEDSAHNLADRIATVSWERELKRPDANLARSSATLAAAFAEPVKKQPVVEAPMQVAAAVPMSVAGDVNDPWDAASAEALTHLYESGSADMIATAAAPKSAPVKPEPMLPITAAPVRHTVMPEAMPHEPSHHTADRAWLDGRFAEIAARIEQSLSEGGPDHAFKAFDSRLTQLEERFGSALETVATRTDVEGLRIIEAHINELTTQFEHANAQLSRLDNVELHLGDLLHQVSDERLSHLFAHSAGASANGSSEEEIEAVAIAVADRVASRLPQQQEVTGADAAVGDIQRLIEGFVAGQRDNEEHTSSMLDTMQQAMIRMLDRMDAIENAAPAYPAPQAAFAAAPQMHPAPQPRTEPQFPEQMPHVAPASAAFAPSMPDEPATAMPTLNAGAAKEDFRAAAIADARRAARKVASQVEGDVPAPALDSGRVRRGVPPVKVSAAEIASGAKASGEKVGSASAGATAARSRVPLMVAGVALVAAVGLLAASVGLNRGLPFMAGTNTARNAPMTVDNGDAGELTATPPMTPNGNAQRPSPAMAPQVPGSPAARPRAESTIENLSDPRDAGTEAAMAQQEASVRSVSPAAASLPMGMAMTKARAVPNDSDLARMRQQRNLTSLANQIAAVQANAPTVPASLIPNGAASLSEADQTLSNDGAKTSEMPPAMIGPISLRTAASKGDPSAEFEVAARFAEGRGIAQDFKQAMIWYQRSAQRGFAPAQYRLGTLFERGIGTKADGARAKIWYGRAAEQGHVKAMHNLAVLSSGREQSADYPTAVTWFTAASEHGLTDSQYNLGVLHESGLGLPRDFKQAYYWLSLAARSGDKDAARRRDQVRMKLEEADVTSTDQAVAVWQAKPSDSSINDARVAGEGWKARQSASR